jgi:hypothetical protein
VRGQASVREVNPSFPVTALGKLAGHLGGRFQGWLSWNESMSTVGRDVETFGSANKRKRDEACTSPIAKQKCNLLGAFLCL